MNGHVQLLPEVERARNHLGSLLNTIRDSSKSSMVSDEDDHASFASIPDFDATAFSSETNNNELSDEMKQKSKVITVDIRQKVFKLPSDCADMSLYSLARAWVHGRDTTDLSANAIESLFKQDPELASSPAPHETVITREVFTLPPPEGTPPPLSVRMPSPVCADEILNDGDAHIQLMLNPDDPKAYLQQQYLPRWKAIKRKWNLRAKQVEYRHRHSLNVINGIYNLAQQTQLAYTTAGNHPVFKVE